VKPEEQRIAIAEWCGRNGWWCPNCKKLVSEYSLGYQARHANCSNSAQQMPDYLNDLNAMHEAELRLGKHIETYRSTLLKVCYKMNTWACEATAAQRAEALLKTLNLWKETK